MKKLLLFCSLIMAFSSFAQHDEAYVDGLTNEFMNKLEARGITSYFSTKHYCSGAIEMFLIDGKMCSSKGTYFETYVFWEEEGTAFVKKIDNCGLFQSVELPTSEVLNYATENVATIKAETVKNYKSEAYTGEPELRKKVQPCFRSFQFKGEGGAFSKSFNLFDISNDSEGKNLNFDYNQNLHLVKLNTQVEDVLKGLSFTRQ